MVALPSLISLVAPISYIAVLLSLLIVFSSLYRKRKAAKAASLEPWFPAHMARDIYLSLLHQEDSTVVPERMLKAALVVRAREDIKRLIKLQQSKNALQVLLQKGCVGDDLWTRFQRAEGELEEELTDVATEADAYQDGWGQVIFKTANEMVNHERIRERAARVATEATAERAWWDQKKSERAAVGLASKYRK
ncbi:Sec62/63 complex, subunit Sec66 [Sphaerosporella brunnea]|uniref:Sec62/63 complex, subunit Sec66 n=1 Tax=Sphaerosporella brunnea TaxID=1250544 RepID=A0A5J5FA39_9PEZI|nr:Sec62/63 complex, subunit Sec66 [Sphaerosporella brunnea]